MEWKGQVGEGKEGKGEMERRGRERREKYHEMKKEDRNGLEKNAEVMEGDKRSEWCREGKGKSEGGGGT